ncbi:hypothetical protein HYPSUDRAFT_34808 [Hypholoma sublateritium FD-334 SS-4]|uniref:Uncharacterized protein n=1 Tax=Hypholoma sublateritium (strain FD-334 SS-4) TaxID=945553 RepID=A0A0D2Q7L0_HYPSF|nr:hypothetical protein HYPSUDRAFT_34808 [Hypholoma sublateritium FD-334 SS-4]
MAAFTAFSKTLKDMRIYFNHEIASLSLPSLPFSSIVFVLILELQYHRSWYDNISDRISLVGQTSLVLSFITV